VGVGKLTEGRVKEGSTKVGRPSETDGKLTDKLGKDDPNDGFKSMLGKFVVVALTRSLIETLGKIGVGSIVEGTVSIGEIEGSDKPSDGKVVRRLSESNVRTSVGSASEGTEICEGIDSDKPLPGSPVVTASSKEGIGKLGMPNDEGIGSCDRSVMGSVAEQRPLEPLPV